MNYKNTNTVGRDLTVLEKFKAWCKAYGPMTIAACAMVHVTVALIYLFAPHTTTQVAVSHRWSRSITVQENREKQADGWRQEFASIDGVSLTCESRRSGYHRCNPHLVVLYDLHGGFRTLREYDWCATYSDWCRGVWREWENVGTHEIHGQEFMDAWPNVNAGPLQRLQRSSVYRVYFDNGRTIECTQDEYRSIYLGSRYNITWTRFDNHANLVRR